MLTSTNQYLRPEYLTPLPTTLDAKKSPLALLAQTCSAIGADSPNPKLISAAEKASLKSTHKYASENNNREKSSPIMVSNTNSESKASFKPYESCLTSRDKTKSPEGRSSSGPRVKTPVSSKGSSSNTPVQPRCSSNLSSSSQRNSPPSQRKSPSEKSIGRASPAQNSPGNSKSNGESSSSSSSLHSPNSLKTGLNLSSDQVKDLHLGSYKNSQIPVSSAYLGGFPTPGFHLPMDLMTSSIMAAQHHALKNGLNPYLNYARMKSSGGGDSMVPVCRDPYCTGCSLSSHLMNGMKQSSGSCPAGCSQCDHAKSPGFPLPPGHPAAAAYAHAQLAALAAASQLPYVCNWMAGDTAYCGKRFSNSDELLQHLRSHTSSLGDSPPSLSMLGSTGLPANHPLLQRSYPTPPLSPLTPRFHPYSKPSHLLTPSTLPFPLPPHPSLAAYFSPYPLFGPRGLHP